MSTIRFDSLKGKDMQVSEFADCENFNDLEARIEDYCARFGLTFFSYLMLRGSHNQPTRFLSNYETEWSSRYVSKSYQHYDPVAVKSKGSRLPFFWNQGRFLKPFVKLQKRVFHEARAFRISAGYSIPVAGPDGDLAVLTMADPDERHLVDVIRSEGSGLLMSALQVHDQAMVLSASPRSSQLAELTDRELDCLKWTADGKTSDEIAEIVLISAPTVNYHLNKAVTKLNAANRLHAAIIAVRNGII